MRQEMMGFWDAVASAGPYAKMCTSLQISTSTPHHSIFTGQMFFLMPTNSVKALKDSNKLTTKSSFKGVIHKQPHKKG